MGKAALNLDFCAARGNLLQCSSESYCRPPWPFPPYTWAARSRYRPLFYLLGSRAIGPQLLQRDFAKALGQCLHVGCQATECRRSLIAALVHIKGAIDLELDGVQPRSRIAVVLGDKSAVVWLITADRIAERAQSLFDRLGHGADTTGAITVSQNKFGPRPFVPMTGGRGHRMAIDEHGSAELPVQPREQPPQGAMVWLVKALNPAQSVVDRDPLVINFLRVPHHSRHGPKATRNAHFTPLGQRGH